MEAGQGGGFKFILERIKLQDKKTLIITTDDFCYTAEILEIYPDSVLILDKFRNEILLSFSAIKQIGGSSRNGF